jgi:hypothetical protein
VTDDDPNGAASGSAAEHAKRRAIDAVYARIEEISRGASPAFPVERSAEGDAPDAVDGRPAFP